MNASAGSTDARIGRRELSTRASASATSPSKPSAAAVRAEAAPAAVAPAAMRETRAIIPMRDADRKSRRFPPAECWSAVVDGKQRPRDRRGLSLVGTRRARGRIAAVTSVSRFLLPYFAVAKFRSIYSCLQVGAVRQRRVAAEPRGGAAHRWRANKQSHLVCVRSTVCRKSYVSCALFICLFNS